MNDPILAGKILQHLLVCNGWRSSDEIAGAINSTPSDVDLALVYVIGEHKDWMRAHLISGGGTNYLLIDHQRSDITYFMKQGGYVNLVQSNEQRTAQEEAFKILQTNNLEATTAQAKQAMKDSRFAKRMAWASLIVAIAAAIISVSKNS